MHKEHLQTLAPGVTGRTERDTAHEHTWPITRVHTNVGYSYHNIRGLNSESGRLRANSLASSSSVYFANVNLGASLLRPFTSR